jgi:hypothetical protein
LLGSVNANDPVGSALSPPAAKALGLTLPTMLLAAADEMIE